MADELEQRLNDPGFTPGIKLVPALLERAARGDATVRERASEALCRVQSAVGEAARRALVTMSAPERRRALAALAGRPRGLEDPALSELCAETLKDEDGALRIAAARVLGKLGGERAEAALVEALARATTEHERDALARALGKCGGGERAREALASLAGGGVSVQRARLMAERSTLRDLPRAPIELGEVPPGAPRVVVTCRRGLEPIVREELGARVARVRRIQEDARGGRLVADLDDGLSTLACVRTALRVGYTFSTPHAPGADEVVLISELLASARVVDALTSVARGPVRFRLELAGGGKRRGAVWRVAEELSRREPRMVNDPRGSDFDVSAWTDRGALHVDVLPRMPDERFAYRVADVPAASHPTLAAALVRVAGARPDDVVWDPFVGSGLELCERALLGPYRSLMGTDTDPVALRRARANLDAAGARASLLCEDARRAGPAGLTTMITNPPMGRRVLAQTDLPRLLEEVVGRAASSLVPGGRVVLLSPHPRTTEVAAERAGLECTLDRRVDMTGFDAVLQRFERPGATPPSGRR
ncbi:MAG: HEAT repeat domain-containing protein [Polyangiaceae bacterium]|nr:HEAT repeat domain-containing protein [Polyangiaceae bacterium]